MTAVDALAAHPWLGVAAALAAFLLLFASLQVYARAARAQPETTRKMFHAGSGTLTLAFPFLFHEFWPVLLLTGASALLVAGVKFVPALSRRLGRVANRVERTTLGELYFPLSVAVLFWLTRGESPLLFVIPILMLTFADATCALVGARYGLTRYEGASKSLEGSIAFVVVAFFCVHVPLLVAGEVGRVESLLIAATLALLVMLLEGSAWRGLDNLFIPLGGYFLLRAFMPLDAAALSARLAVTAGLVALVVLVRRRTTLEDDALVAGAFFCYVAWALMGWQWLLGPLAVAFGYAWLSPPTPENSRRMHDVPAVLSVWAPALVWLTLARAGGGEWLVFPYTTVFAGHLAIFGLSRLGHQFPERPLAGLFLRAAATSWSIVALPLLAATGPRLMAAAAATIALAVVAGAGLFLLSERRIRDVPLTAQRWMRQAAAAAAASAAAWGVLQILMPSLV